MLLKYITAGVVGSALLATAAFAEPPTAISQSDLHGTWRASKVVGLSVYNDNNEKIGAINDLLMDKGGSIKAAVIGVGGFLGVGERLVAVSFDKMKFSDQPVSSATASNTSPPGNRPPSTTTTGSANGSPSSANASKSNPWYPDHAVFNASKDDLNKMTEFKYNE
ncbi:PRC-barrel domain-containing protein [Bradyrhizobium sp. STM 3562]|jgi:sporulation protein YlmC with PRC-barrel domain|uniref:PRC-barrel domain-containing protein n=1 Tax=Bradyrhizobium sp. STM 3562 TaxID=578924 RepID=UPI00388D73DB